MNSQKREGGEGTEGNHDHLICIRTKHMKFILFFISSKLNYNHYHHGKKSAC